jgi:hypothetical protein
MACCLQFLEGLLLEGGQGLKWCMELGYKPLKVHCSCSCSLLKQSNQSAGASHLRGLHPSKNMHTVSCSAALCRARQAS